MNVYICICNCSSLEHYLTIYCYTIGPFNIWFIYYSTEVLVKQNWNVFSISGNTIFCWYDLTWASDSVTFSCVTHQKGDGLRKEFWFSDFVTLESVLSYLLNLCVTITRVEVTVNPVAVIIITVHCLHPVIQLYSCLLDVACGSQIKIDFAVQETCS